MQLAQAEARIEIFRVQSQLWLQSIYPYTTYLILCMYSWSSFAWSCMCMCVGFLFKAAMMITEVCIMCAHLISSWGPLQVPPWQPKTPPVSLSVSAVVYAVAKTLERYLTTCAANPFTSSCSQLALSSTALALSILSGLAQRF